MKRREFIVGLGGRWRCAGGTRTAARASRRCVPSWPPDDPEFQARNAAFLQGLGELGWTGGRNCGSTTAGVAVTPNAIVLTPQN